MKRALLVLSLVSIGLVLGFAAHQTADAAPPISKDGVVRWMQAGMWVMPQTIGGQTNAANKVTRMLGASSTIDFAAATITTVDSAAITVTGAQVGDPCFVGPPAAVVVNASFTCLVTAADAVKVRFTPAGTIADPLSGTFFVRVISSQ